MPGRETPSGPLCGAYAWLCTGSIPWCGRRRGFPDRLRACLRRARSAEPGAGGTPGLRPDTAGLIPVRRAGTALLSATTMTSGKRRLKDRITRIAQGQQTRAAALFLVLALAAGVCAVTFTGAKADGETGGVRSLTGASWRILMRSSSIRMVLTASATSF